MFDACDRKPVGRELQFAVMMQERWKKEIEAAIREVKSDVPAKKREWPRRRKRGYWTPMGFVWFNRRVRPKRGKWRHQSNKRGVAGRADELVTGSR